MARLLEEGVDVNALLLTDNNDPTRPGRKVQGTALPEAIGSEQEAAAHGCWSMGRIRRSRTAWATRR